VELRDKLMIRQEIEALTIEFWYQVDLHFGRTAHEFFVRDGTFRVADRVYNGAEEIRQFYKWRETRGIRTARHIISNLRVTVESETRASAISFMTLHVADGPPVLPAKAPVQVADISDVLVRESDGQWRYVSRSLDPIFNEAAQIIVKPPAA
jgi:hypothetical protein